MYRKTQIFTRPDDSLRVVQSYAPSHPHLVPQAFLVWTDLRRLWICLKGSIPLALGKSNFFFFFFNILPSATLIALTEGRWHRSRTSLWKQTNRRSQPWESSEGVCPSVSAGGGAHAGGSYCLGMWDFHRAQVLLPPVSHRLYWRYSGLQSIFG